MDHKKPEIFYESTKVELKTSLLSIVPIKTRLYLEICARNKNGESR